MADNTEGLVVRDGWEVKTLGDICHFVRGPFGGSLKKNCFVSKGNAVYEQQHAINNQFSEIRYFVDDNKFDEMQRFELKPGDLIMSCSGTMGKVSIVPKGIKKGIINQALLKLTPSNKLNVEYLKYWMISNDFQESLAKFTVGAAIKNVASVKILKQIEIPCPIVSTQKQIVALLDQAFEAIDQAQFNIEQNIKNAKELFQSKLNDIFSQTGDGWEERLFLDIADLIDSLHKTPKYAIDGYSMVRVTDITSRFLDLSKTKKVNKDTFDEFSKRHSPEIGDIIFSRVGSYGKSTLVNSIDIPFCLGQNTVYIIPKINPTFLYYFLNSPNCREQIDKLKSGTTQPTVSLKSIKSIIVPIPTKTEQTKCVELLDSLFLKVENLYKLYEKELKNLEELKKSILQKAFNGELTK